MSINIKFESNLGKFNPIQTPSQITWTLLTSDKYGPKDKTGKKALKVLYQSGDEGGEILMSKPVTNTSISGSGVTFDIYQNRIRFFEQGSPNRGAYLDITECAGGAGTNILSGGASGISGLFKPAVS